MEPEDLIAKVFGVDRYAIDENASNATLTEWDSLGHMTLIMEIENVYGIALTPEEAMAATDLQAIKRLLAERGARW